MPRAAATDEILLIALSALEIGALDGRKFSSQFGVPKSAHFHLLAASISKRLRYLTARFENDS